MKYLKYIICLILILSNCFISYSNDSIKVSIDDIRYINERLIISDNLEKQVELYKTLNSNNKELINSLLKDNIVLKEDNLRVINKYNREHNKVKVLFGTCCGFTICIIIMLI